MSQFMRFFSGKCQYFGNRAGVKHLTNIMSVHLVQIHFDSGNYYKDHHGGNDHQDHHLVNDHPRSPLSTL